MAEDAIALLKADHRKVEDLFKEFEKATRSDRKRTLAEQICLELTIHTKLEEEIFYPACEGHVDEALIKEAYVEHDGAKVLISEIEAGGPGDEFYDAKVKVLSEQAACPRRRPRPSTRSKSNRLDSGGDCADKALKRSLPMATIAAVYGIAVISWPACRRRERR